MTNAEVSAVIQYFIEACAPLYTSHDFGVFTSVYLVTDSDRLRFPFLMDRTVTITSTPRQ